MSSLSLVALMLLHFNCSAPLSQSFMQFCWLHYLFTTSPLFANVLMSEFELFIYCCCAVSLNEYASLTIHHIMHIWSSQFKDNSSCHSHADLWYKDTSHCPCLSQNTSSFYQQSLRAFLPSLKNAEADPNHQEDKNMHNQGFFGPCLNLQKNGRNLFFPKLHHYLPSRCHLSSLFLQLILTRSGKLSHLPLWFGLELKPNWRTEDALRTAPCNFHHLLFKTFYDVLLLIRM